MRHRGFVPAALVLAALAAGARPARAQDPWEKSPFEAPARELLDAAKAVKAEEGSSLVILLNEVRWSFSADGRAETRTLTVYRVLNEDGVESVSVVRADWGPWYQAKPAIRGRVTTPDGKTHVLNPATLSERPVASNDSEVFTDRRVVTGPLPAVAVGSVVEVEVVTSQTKPFFAGGTTNYHYFGSGQPVHRERLVLDVPEGL